MQRKSIEKKTTIVGSVVVVDNQILCCQTQHAKVFSQLRVHTLSVEECEFNKLAHIAATVFRRHAHAQAIFAYLCSEFVFVVEGNTTSDWSLRHDTNQQRNEIKTKNCNANSLWPVVVVSVLSLCAVRSSGCRKYAAGCCDSTLEHTTHISAVGTEPSSTICSREINKQIPRK